ncbi:S-DNA-T family DNA segregation ATPase FtsK/SpoIIIE [Streptacidiphilus sp. MAP12-33]|uniref:FtsK/SpoIIIE domain-containing protein n=1 Tax=Streptacidiphilus sp. MAP12-33 TaxID=3156266 RepID=UPI003515E169
MNDLLALIETGAPLATVAGGALYTRSHAPRAYWSAVGLPATLVRMRRDWAETMDACGLATEPPLWRILATQRGDNAVRRPVPPKVRMVQPSTMGVRVRIRLAKGMTTETVSKAAEALRHAWQVHAVYVTEVRPGVVDLRIMGFDVLANVVVPSRITAKNTGPVRVPVALASDGRPYVRDYRAVPHGLTLGANQSGKSMFARNLVHGLASQPVALCGIDCKKGVEQAPFGPRLSALAIDPDLALDLLRVLVNVEMARRYDLIRDHLGIPGTVGDGEIAADVWGLPEPLRPVPLVLIVDEIAELLLSTKKNDPRRDETITLLVRFAQLARAAGMYLEVMGQRFGADLGPGATLLRSQLTNRVVHRVNDTESARMGLGDVSDEAMHAATALSPYLPGCAIVGDTSGQWQRIRTPYRSLSETARHCAAHAHLVPDLPALNPFRPVPPADAVPEDAPVYIPAPAAS